MDLNGIQNVGEFYSHHYLDSLLENDLKGLFAQWREEDEHTPDKRLNSLSTAFYQAKQNALRARSNDARYKASHAFHVDLLEALGYEYHFHLRYLLEGESVPILGTALRDGQEYLWLVETPFTDEDTSPLEQAVFREQCPPQSQDAELQLPEDLWESLIAEIFRRDNPPRWVILLAGSLVFLFDRTKWGYGQYLLFDLDEVFGRRQTETLRAVAALLGRDALAPDDGIPLHDTLDENSHKHAYGVSQDLKYGVRLAVELLANEYVYYQRTVAKQALYQDEDLARKLTNETLTYLYRLLFLFYAEARGGELSVVPMKSEAYRTGYSLEMLRDLELVPLNTPQAQDGYFIEQSLEKLFLLVNDGYADRPEQLALEGPEIIYEYGFSLPGLHNPLFDRASTPLFSSVKFRNKVLQEVIQLLSLSKEEKYRKHGRGRISYAQLGINQLGAVYEGLLSFSGFFAQEDLYEVKSAKDKKVTPETQTYFIPIDERERYTADEFIYDEMPDGTRQRRRIEKGKFIFRMAGRDREKSASYYTPEVLTQCVVKYSLKELLIDKSADEILKLTICEPAMGSGAFINEALNQLADAYLVRKQDELGERIPADEYREERQKVKAYLAVNNAYGVDLNPTAVELARVSLWLNIIYEGAESPWFGPRLAVGNSLIGARRQVYNAEDILSGEYAKKAPEDVPLGDDQGGFGSRPVGTVYHWLLPDAGMAAFDKDKVIKELAPDKVQAIKDWRKSFTKKVTKAELKTMQALSDAADKLWESHWREREVVLARTKQEIHVWGQASSDDVIASRQRGETISIQQKERELAYLNRPTSPYRRLKLAMDYWCALWFWPIPEAKQLPTRVQYLNEISELFKHATDEFKRLPEQLDLFGTQQKPKQQSFADLPIPNIDILCREYTRLGLVYTVALKMKFQHWEQVFPEVFINQVGFDLILGNPPWVLPEFSETGVLADYDPVIIIKNFTSKQVAEQRHGFISSPHIEEVYIDEYVELSGFKSFTGATTNYSLLGGRVNTYKCFIVLGWSICSENGILGLLHPEGVYDDPKGGNLRSNIYSRLQYHFQFQNELKLFQEIGNRNQFSINVYRKNIAVIKFDHISNIFHPVTIDQCYLSDGEGSVPGIKDLKSHWELRGHKMRINKIDIDALGILVLVFDESGTLPDHARLPSIHSIQITKVLEKFTLQPRKLGSISDKYFVTPSTFWNETTAQTDGYIKRETRFPLTVDEWVISGPHFHVANPLFQTPNKVCNTHRAYTANDLTQIPDNYLPRTNYTPNISIKGYRDRIPLWEERPVTEFYRHVNREMIGQAGERTLINAIVPPGSTSINTVLAISFANNFLLTQFSGFCSSIVYDFFIKSTGKTHLNHNLATLLPLPKDLELSRLVINRTLRLNCITSHYSDLWSELYKIDIRQDRFAKNDPRLKSWETLTSNWQRDVALRTHFERRQALVEIDVLAAMALDLTLDELLTIYRVQFPVLQEHDRRLQFDQHGMIVPVKTVRGVLMVKEEDEKFPEMVPPFTPVDREADYREAWSHFERVLREDNTQESIS